MAAGAGFMMAAPMVSYGFAAPVQTQTYALAPSVAYGAAPGVAFGSVPSFTFGAAPSIAFGAAPTVAFGAVPNVSLGSAADLQSAMDAAFERKLREFNVGRSDSGFQGPTFLGDARAILDIIRMLPRFRDEPDCESKKRDNETIEDLRARVRRLERDVEELRRSAVQGGDGGGFHQDTSARGRARQSLTSVRHPTESSESAGTESKPSRDPLMDRFDRISSDAKSTMVRLRSLK
jgi:hypothetical protein